MIHFQSLIFSKSLCYSNSDPLFMIEVVEAEHHSTTYNTEQHNTTPHYNTTEAQQYNKNSMTFISTKKWLSLSCMTSQKVEFGLAASQNSNII